MLMEAAEVFSVGCSSSSESSLMAFINESKSPENIPRGLCG